MGAKKRAKPGVLFYEDLSDDAQKSAIEWYRDQQNEGWCVSDSEMMTEMLQEQAAYHFQLKTDELQWSLSYCHGDGVAFYGNLDLDFLCADRKEPMPEKGWPAEPSRDRIAAIVYRLKSMHCEVSAHIDGANYHYHHWNSMSARVEITESLRYRDRFYEVNEFCVHLSKMLAGSMPFPDSVIHFDDHGYDDAMMDRLHQAYVDEDDAAAMVCFDYFEEKGFDVTRLRLTFDPKEPWEGLANDLEKAIDEYLKTASKYVEQVGYSELEYRDSDEAIEENIKANGYEFDEDGGFIG